MSSTAMIGMPGKDITIMINDLCQREYPAGKYIFDFMVASSGGTKAAWQLTRATEWRVLEVIMPPAIYV